MAQPVDVGVKYLSTNLWSRKVRDENGVERTIYDTDGALYQGGTKITADAAEINKLDGMVLTQAQMNGACIAFYARVSTAQVNAGYDLLTPSATGQYRIMDVKLRAIGGNAGAVTTVDVKEETSGNLIFQAPAANLLANVTIGVDAANIVDTYLGIATTAGKKISIVKAGSDMTTATHIDVMMIYSIVAT